MTYSLYYYDSCPFCQLVLRSLPNVSVEVEKRNVMKNPDFRKQLSQATGRTQVPCLRIQNGDDDQWMFESSDIVRYLQSL